MAMPHDQLLRQKNKSDLISLLALVLVVVGVFSFAHRSHALVVTENRSISISAEVSSGLPTPTSGGGGGSSSSEYGALKLSGKAYPFSSIVVLKNGQEFASSRADIFSRFSINILDIIPGTYTFSVRASDGEGRQSVLHTFPLIINKNITASIDTILIPPTIQVNPSSVGLAQKFTIKGQSSSLSRIRIFVGENQYEAVADLVGNYTLELNSSLFSNGQYVVRAQSLIEPDQETALGAFMSLMVSPLSPEEEILTGCGGGDYNCDKSISLADFSVLSFWFKKPSPPARIDLNADGIVNLIDFSILAFSWSG